MRFPSALSVCGVGGNKRGAITENNSARKKRGRRMREGHETQMG